MRYLVLLLLMLAASARAYQVQPMIVEMDAQGKKTLATYRLQNPGAEPLPVEVAVFKRTFDDEQKEVLVPAEDDFLVLPPQIEVPANGYQVFRAKYLGKPNLAQTESYRIVFKQLPLADTKDKSGVKMMFNFATLVFVHPQGVNAKPTSELDCKTIEACTLTIGNTGTRVLDLSHYDYRFDGEQRTFDWSRFQAITPGRFIMPGHKMTLILKDLLEGQAAKDAKMVNLFVPEP